MRKSSIIALLCLCGLILASCGEKDETAIGNKISDVNSSNKTSDISSQTHEENESSSNIDGKADGEKLMKFLEDAFLPESSVIDTPSSLTVTEPPVEVDEDYTKWYTLEIDDNHTVTRNDTSKTDVLTWEIKCDGEILLKRNAENEMSYNYQSNREGLFEITLLGLVNGEYMPISNTVTYVANAENQNARTGEDLEYYNLKSKYKNTLKVINFEFEDSQVYEFNRSCIYLGDFDHNGKADAVTIFYNNEIKKAYIGFNSDSETSNNFSNYGFDNIEFYLWQDTKNNKSYLLEYIKEGSITTVFDPINNIEIAKIDGENYTLFGKESTKKAYNDLGIEKDRFIFYDIDNDNAYVFRNNEVRLESVYD